MPAGFRAPATLLLPATKQHAFLTRLVTCLPNPLYKRLFVALRSRGQVDQGILQRRIERVLSEAGAHHLSSTMNDMMPDVPIQSLEQARLEVDLQRLRRDFFPDAKISDDERFATLSKFAERLSSTEMPPSIIRQIMKKTAWLERKRQEHIDAGISPVHYDLACNYLTRIRSFLGETRVPSCFYGFYKYLLQIRALHIELIPAPAPVIEPKEIPDLSDPKVKQTYHDFLNRVASSLSEQTYITVAKAIYQLQSKREGRAGGEHDLFTLTDFRQYLHKLRHALVENDPQFLDDFKLFAPVIEVEDLEKARMVFNKIEVYRLEMLSGEWTNNPILASNVFYHKEEFRHKIFVDNLPLDVTLDDIRKSFHSIGKVVAVELFKERIARRPLNLQPPVLPALPKPLNLDDNTDETEVDEVIEAATIHEDAVVVVDEQRPKRNLATKKSRLKPKPIPDSRLYAAVYFEDERSVERALDHAIRIFGVAMEDKIVHDAQCKTVFRQCRTSWAPSALFVGNIPIEVCGYSVETEFHKLLCSIESFPEIQSCIQTDYINIGRGSLVMLFNHHTDALAAYRSLVGRCLRGRPLRIGWMVDAEVKSILMRNRKKLIVESRMQTFFDFSQFKGIQLDAGRP